MEPADANRNRPDGAALWASALGWWNDAGVDLQFSDEAAIWMQDEPAKQAPPSPSGMASNAAARPAPSREPSAHAPAPVSPYPDRASWPQQLADFADWWLGEPSLDAGGASPRIAPRGPEQPALMVLVPEPEAEDREQLLSGAHGRFLDAMLDAMGIPSEQTYRASALPRHTPLADWDLLARHGMGEIMRHHIALVAPQRLMVLGQNILPLLGHDTAQSPAHLRFLNHGDTSTPVFAGWDIGSLLGRAKARSGFWQRWLEWTALDRQG